MCIVFATHRVYELSKYDETITICVVRMSEDAHSHSRDDLPSFRQANRFSFRVAQVVEP